MIIENVLEKLRMLDLSQGPYFDAKNLIREIGVSVYMHFTLHNGCPVFRARLNLHENGKFIAFSRRNELSYPPSSLIKKYQRANLPYRSMFYGTIVENNVPLACARLIAACETSTLLNSDDRQGIEIITYGRWITKGSINLVALIPSHEYDIDEDNPSLLKMKKDFDSFVSYNPLLKDKALMIFDFWAKEFSKDVNNDYEYLLSALLTEIVTEREDIDGVLYPSVKAQGKFGFCVAIKPSTADKLYLDAVVECTIHKNGERSNITVDKKATNIENQEYFTLKTVSI